MGKIGKPPTIVHDGSQIGIGPYGRQAFSASRPSISRTTRTLFPKRMFSLSWKSSTPPWEPPRPKKSATDTGGFIRKIRMLWPNAKRSELEDIDITLHRSTESLPIGVDFETRELWSQLLHLPEEHADESDEERRTGFETREYILSKIPPFLRNLDVTKLVVDKQNPMVANGAYCDIFVGRMPCERLRCRIIHRRPGTAVVKVAIKRLRVRINQEEAELIESFTREMIIWVGLDHPNILPFIGFIIEDGYLSFISEWMVLGSLRGSLKKNSTECSIVRLALGIAEGLRYLHDRDIVHSDIKSDNVLISESFQPLICDFGISRMIHSSETLLRLSKQDNPKGSTRWMAKELLQVEEGMPPKVHSKESDVWAYGMTLYEMVSRQVPFTHLKQDVHVLFAVLNGELPKLPNSPTSDMSVSATEYSELRSMCTRCWADNPADRPTMAQIIHTLSLLDGSLAGGQTIGD